MKTGYVTIVGRPNVGKSTLLNHLVGQKVSITSRRPQTTRHRIQGIKTTDQAQLIFIDTPGIHISRQRAMNRYLNQTATASLAGVDVIVWMTDRLAWHPEDELVFNTISTLDIPILLVINKVDRLEDKSRLLPWLQTAAQRHPFVDLIPLSALKGSNLATLEQKIIDCLPEAEPVYPDDQITDRSERFMAAEIIREKLLRCLAQEVPHALTVEIERFQQHGSTIRIHGLIWVEREGQKAIVIGQGGEVLKKVGERSRMDLEKMLDSKVYLELWVKVKKGWSDDERALHSLGYVD
ncbi:MAG: GTPase Era [Methylococcaceae bacterium]